jgi:DNA polymerase-1
MSKETKKLFIVDGHAHIYAAYYAPMRPLNSPSGEPTKAVFVFTTAILGLLEREKPDMLVVAMDSKTPSFRTKIYREYKAHRPPMPEDMPRQIDRIEQILEAMNIPMLRVDGWEADDLIGTLTAEAAKAGIDAYICSKDKDMLQLLQKHVSTYDIKTGQKTDLQKLHEEIKLRPRQFIDVLALQGDASDNVPGVPDVGPKTALEWIQKYGSLEELYSHADEIKGKRGDNLRNFKDLAFLSQKLVTIDCDAPVKLDEAKFAIHEPDKGKLAGIFKELGFTRLLGQLNISTEAPSVSAGMNAKTAKETVPAGRQGTLFAVAAEKSAKTTDKDYQLIDTPQKFDEFFRRLYRQKSFAVDTETTSIDPMRAELVGMSFCWKERQAYYLPVRAPLGQKRLDLSKIRPVLASVLADAKRYKIGQNLKYDMPVLENAGMPLAVKDGGTFDTMVASYCLHADRSSHSMDAMARDYLNYEPIPISDLIGKGKNQITFDMVDTASGCEYSAEDADVTYQLWQYLSARLDAQPTLKKLFEELEMPLVSVLARMESNGVSLDTDLLKRMSKTINKQVEQLTDKIFALAGLPFNIDSTKQLAEILFDRLGLQSVRRGKTQRSTDADVLEQLSHQHPIVPLILEYRQLVKLQNTYIDKLPLLVNPKTQRVHASFNQTVTATGRLSSSDPNLQNIPIRTELGKQIRAAFVPKEKDGCILSADYSQIELRLLAHFSKDKALLKAFADDMDIHTFVASQIYGIPADEVSSEMRTKAKAVNFGIIYGQGPYGLSQNVGISQAEAKKFIDDYYARYPAIRKFMDGEIDKAAKSGYAQTILGRRRPITGLNSKNHNVRSLAERLTVNTVIQGSAADLIKMAMIAIGRRIDKDGLPIKMILQIHDELVFELPEKDANKHAKWISAEMTGAIQLDVPLKVDISIGKSWLQ